MRVPTHRDRDPEQMGNADTFVDTQDDKGRGAQDDKGRRGVTLWRMYWC